MAFQKVQSGGALNFQKWDAPKTVDGVIDGFHHDEYDGKPTVGVILKLEDGSRATYPVVKAIEKIVGMAVGTLVRLDYTGPGKTAKGKPFKKVDLYVDDAPVAEQAEEPAF